MSQLKACVLLRDHLGERHEGSITGLAGHGLYVTLDAWWVEGLVHVSRLRGHYELEESGKALVGPGRRYALGDRVEVEIAASDPVAGRIDFELVERRERGRDAAARPARARSSSESRSQRAGKRTRRPSRVRKRK
ncbi:MAG: S1 RNA-binding domain-containing protein [Myxococcota bacterium]